MIIQEKNAMSKRVLLHAAFWFAYVLFKAYLNYDWVAAKFAGHTPAEIFLRCTGVQLVYLAAKIPLVYCLFYITEKSLSSKWPYAKSITAALIVFVFSVFAFLIIDNFIIQDIVFGPPHTFHIEWMSIIYTSFLLSFTCGLALAIKLIRINIRQKETGHEIMKQKLETELRFLKAQTNPHFLFNTLNNIYALARKKSDATADVVMRLSGLLRFMLYEAEKKIIPAGDELKMIESYIELEKIRYTSDKLKVSFRTSVDNYQQPIAPLILLPFVENAFKHGAGESRFESVINIDTQLKKGILNFSVENSKPAESNKNTDQKIGLHNVCRQLELLYPDHTLIIKNEASVFTINLTVNLNGYAAI